MTRKIITKSIPNLPKIDENRSLDWSRGLLGGPWESFWLPRPAWDSKDGPDCQNVSQNGSPFGGPFLSFFVVFNMFVRSFFETRFGSYQYWFLMDLGSLFRSFVEAFLDTFRDRWQVTKMSFGYSIYYVLSTSASWTVRGKSQMLATFLDSFSRWLPTSCFHRFGLDLDSILGGFLKV